LTEHEPEDLCFSQSEFHYRSLFYIYCSNGSRRASVFAMNNQQAYNVWAETYDAVENKTRDLEAFALRSSFPSSEKGLDILEIGCGTGKNTEWLQTKAAHLTCADFSAEMLAIAREKITASNVEFKQLDLREDWGFGENLFDFVSCSLALEHIENIEFVFAQAHKVLRAGGRFYVGELHPFKQYQGTKARFEFETKRFELECFTHHASDFFQSAKKCGFELIDLREWFDDEDKENPPRILSMIFKSQK
jgi:ubiquinone/menaquinone biosynthesis C-methylase UbiE